MALAPGVRLGSYEIVSDLDVGGMGEIYRARNPKRDSKAILVAVASFLLLALSAPTGAQTTAARDGWVAGDGWVEGPTGEVACGGRFRGFHIGATGQVCLGGLFDSVVLDATSPLVQASPSSELGSATSERTEPSNISRPTTTRLPANARVVGNQWFCNSGFRRVGEGCVEMTREEQLAQLRLLAAMRASGLSENLEGNEFSLRDVERRCEAYRHSDNYGDLECSGSELRIVARSCDVYFYDSDNGEIECRGGTLNPIERRCSVSLYSDQYGNVSCR